MPLNTQALSNKFGVTITGVDLSKELGRTPAIVGFAQ
jgi:hypothetical protein